MDPHESFEDAGNDFNPSLFQSTPRKAKAVNDTVASTSGYSLNITELSFSQLESSRPKRKAQFKIPTGPAKKRKVKPIHVCPVCNKGYVCTPSYKTHVLNHQVQDAASRYPDKDVLLGHSHEASVKALNAVSEAPGFGKGGVKLKELVGVLKAQNNSDSQKEFSEKVCCMVLDNAAGVKFLLPSKLLTVFTDQVETILSDSQNHDVLWDVMGATVEPFVEVKSQFLLEFVIAFMHALLKFISLKICGSSTPFQREIRPITQDEREVVYYVAGCIMRGYRNLAYRYKKSAKWQALYHSIKEHVLTEDHVGDSNWTLSLDRGGLLYVTRQCQDFFLELVKLAYAAEEEDGSINYQRVIERASHTYLPVMWDVMFPDCFSEQVSLNFMNDVIVNFCRTCGHSFAKKRLNNLRKGPIISMPTRHKVASRKNQ